MSQEGISTVYAHDHDELDNFLKEFQCLKRKDFDVAKPFFRSFKNGLLRHISWEEEILFPVFEFKTGMKDSGPTAVMRREHTLIKKALEALHEKVRQHNPDSEQEEQVLVSLLREHNDKEEQILYPAIDVMTTAQEKELIFKQMTAVPKEPSGGCCCGH